MFFMENSNLNCIEKNVVMVKFIENKNLMFVMGLLK